MYGEKINGKNLSRTTNRSVNYSRENTTVAGDVFIKPLIMHSRWWTRVTRVSEMARTRIAMARESSRREIEQRGKQIIITMHMAGEQISSVLRATRPYGDFPKHGMRTINNEIMTVVGVYDDNYYKRSRFVYNDITLRRAAITANGRRCRNILLSTGPLCSLSVHIFRPELAALYVK